eukprot:16447690-Heterocapsa_arctica.AAC.1
MSSGTIKETVPLRSFPPPDIRLSSSAVYVIPLPLWLRNGSSSIPPTPFSRRFVQHDKRFARHHTAIAR